MKCRALIMLMVGAAFLSTSIPAQAGWRERHESGKRNVYSNWRKIKSNADNANRIAGETTSKAVGALGSVANSATGNVPVPEICGKIIGRQLPGAVVGLGQTGYQYGKGFIKKNKANNQ